jgi:hypothetical protein
MTNVTPEIAYRWRSDATGDKPIFGAPFCLDPQRGAALVRPRQASIRRFEAA